MKGSSILANQYTSGWTDEQKSFLANHVGDWSFEKIAKKLGKTAGAVESQIDKMGIANTKLSSGFLTMHELAIGLCVSDKKVKRLIDKCGLPAERKDFRAGDRYSYDEDGNKKEKRLFYYINMDKFWKWAEKNKDEINWHQVPKYAFAYEPSWLDERRKEDYYKWLKRKRQYTSEQDHLLLHLYYNQGLKQKEIALLLGRSTGSVEKRLKRLREQNKQAN